MSEDKKETKPKKAPKADAAGADAKAGKPKAEKKAKGKGEAPEGAAATGQSASTRSKAITLAAGEKYVPRARKRYDDVVRKQLMEQFNYQNHMQIPKLDKIVINMGVGEAVKDTKKVKKAAEELTLIAGQKAVITHAKKSVASFRVREEMPLGCKVTLRGDKMYEFIDRLITIALPRVRDFRGVKGTSFDGRGNYAMGLKEQIVFPEIEFDKVDEVLGMDIIICTTAKTDAEAKALLKQFNMPFTS